MDKELEVEVTHAKADGLCVMCSNKSSNVLYVCTYVRM